jgi:hypothetical protein
MMLWYFYDYLDVELRECHQKSIAHPDDQTTSIKAADGGSSHHDNIGNVD